MFHTWSSQYRKVRQKQLGQLVIPRNGKEEMRCDRTIMHGRTVEYKSNTGRFPRRMSSCGWQMIFRACNTAATPSREARKGPSLVHMISWMVVKRLLDRTGFSMLRGPVKQTRWADCWFDPRVWISHAACIRSSAARLVHQSTKAPGRTSRYVSC